eukprot:scaffold103684_cov52-Phaeocystis_antarctica.AAC.3
MRCRARYTGQRAGGGGRPRCKQRVGQGLTANWGQGTGREERTLNMPSMVVTLEVSKVSGWLNADAPCRVERRACGAGRGADRQTGSMARLQIKGRARVERTRNM